MQGAMQSGVNGGGGGGGGGGHLPPGARGWLQAKILKSPLYSLYGFYIVHMIPLTFGNDGSQRGRSMYSINI